MDIRISASAEIEAPAATVYELIADYRNGHPRILPPEYFGRLDVLEGGRGEGTKIRFEMKAFGRVNVAEARITEPAPGRELHETLGDGTLTAFVVEPLGDSKSRVTITTSYRRGGLRGLVEAILAPRYLARVYAAELAQLVREATGRREPERRAESAVLQ